MQGDGAYRVLYTTIFVQGGSSEGAWKEVNTNGAQDIEVQCPLALSLDTGLRFKPAKFDIGNLDFPEILKVCVCVFVLIPDKYYQSNSLYTPPLLKHVP